MAATVPAPRVLRRRAAVAPPAAQLRVRAGGGVLGQGEGALQTGALGVRGALQRTPEPGDDIGGVAEDEYGEGLGLLEHAHDPPLPGPARLSPELSRI